MGNRCGPSYWHNPARWAGNLKELLPAASKLKRVAHQPALQARDAPHWFANLSQRDGNGSRALEFAALTAARSREVRGAVWSEIDFITNLWIIPAERMKMDREHRVPLSSAAIKLLENQPHFQDNDLIFAAPRGCEMSDMTLSAAMQRIHKDHSKENGVGYIDRVSKRPAVPHGLRSTFRDWISEHTEFPGDMAEVALAHKVGNAVEAAYRRGDMLEKRRGMMDVWANFLQQNL